MRTLRVPYTRPLRVGILVYLIGHLTVSATLLSSLNYSQTSKKNPALLTAAT